MISDVSNACINVNSEGEGGQTPRILRENFCVRNPPPGHYFLVRIAWVNLGEKSFLTHIFHLSDFPNPWGGAGVLCQNYGGGAGAHAHAHVIILGVPALHPAG